MKITWDMFSRGRVNCIYFVVLCFNVRLGLFLAAVCLIGDFPKILKSCVKSLTLSPKINVGRCG
jgi:hypothetical protein